MNTTLSPHDIHRLLHAEHDDPFGVLGSHQIDQVWVVRSLRPDAKELAIVDRHNFERRFPATRIAEEGLFEAQLEGVSDTFEYLVELNTGRKKPSRSATHGLHPYRIMARRRAPL